MEIMLNQVQLQPRLDALLAEAARVDQELAQAIAMATGEAPIPTPPIPTTRTFRSMRCCSLPDDPKQFHDLWEKLDQEEKDWLYQQDDNIANYPGMPFDDKDIYNQRHLAELTSRPKRTLTGSHGEHPDWARDPALLNMPGYPPPGWGQQWRQQWDKANHTLDGYKSVASTLHANDGIPRSPVYIDDQGHAAVSIGNPDTATHTATLVPGTGQDLAAFAGARTISQ